MRLLTLAHDAFGRPRAKTANAAVIYARNGWSGDEVVGVVDRSKAGQDAGEFLKDAAGVPVRASVRDALDLHADALVIGIAPSGGKLPADWRDEIVMALQQGMTIISGLHMPLGRDAEFAQLAQQHGGRIRDLRFEHPPQRVTDGSGLFVDSLVVLHVGTDCNSGKMTSAIELTREARRRGLKAEFVATGQTGLLVGCAAGAPIDALVSDFVAGAVEECVVKAAQSQPDIVFVEGQGSLTHPAYSGVTTSLLHGAFPDVLIMADEPRREFLAYDGAVRFVKNAPARERDLNEAHLAPTSRGRVGAAALVTRGLTEEEYRAEVATAEAELGVPAGDVFRGGAPRILDGVLDMARKQGLWDDNGFRRGVKPSRAKEGRV